jgi:uncharacterized protein
MARTGRTVSVADEPQVVDVPEAGRYELRLEGRMIGDAAYRRRNGRIVFTHTEVDEAPEGHGFGSVLAAEALEDVRAQDPRGRPALPVHVRLHRTAS